MKRDKVIVTKRRYGLLRMFILIVVLSAEFIFTVESGSSKVGDSNFIWLYTAYIMLTILFFANSHSKGVYLKYEAALSLVIKCVVINLITGFFLCALSEIESKGGLWLRLFVMTVINIISISLVCIFMDWYARLKNPQGRSMLHICEPGTELDEYEGCDVFYIDDFPDTEKLSEKISRYDQVYLHDLTAWHRNIVMKLCFEKEITVFCTVRVADILLKSYGIAQDADIPVYYCTSFGIGRASAFIERCFDIGASLAALIITSPVMLITAVLIKCEDGGPVIYSQTRCTKDMKEFKIYKFRSMAQSDDGKVCLATEDKHRITRVGKFIRRYKIDELPQFVNILKGEMSIVGPRPERPELMAEAVREIPEFTLRTKVKAGLTGYAQVRSCYNTSYQEKLLWDLMYIQNFSLLLDIKIMIMTVFAIFSGNIREV